MKIPTTLKHKPVFVCEDYAAIDGRSAGTTDVQGLSLGLAQWNDRGRVDISAKIWRYTGEKWSRQSEEMPLHRVLDLALMICSTLRHQREAYRNEQNPDNPVFDRIALQGGALTNAICTDNPYLEQDLELFQRALSEDDELLSERLHRLSDLLRDMGYGTGTRRQA